MSKNFVMEGVAYGTIRPSRVVSGSESYGLGTMERGQSFSDIGRNLGQHAGSIHGVVSGHGGIFLCPRRRSRWALSMTEREDISRGLAAHYSFRHIAAALGRSPSTVSREVARHGGRQCYRATLADMSAWEQVRRPKRCRLAAQPRLRRLVADKLAGDWSPEQIAGWLKRQFPEDTRMRISYETIYRSLFIHTRGVLKKELTRHLRTRRTMRRAKRASTEGQPRGQIIDGISIRERPAAIHDRAIPGHWEGD
jgi:transposase, IS30 family